MASELPQGSENDDRFRTTTLSGTEQLIAAGDLEEDEWAGDMPRPKFDVRYPLLEGPRNRTYSDMTSDAVTVGYGSVEEQPSHAGYTGSIVSRQTQMTTSIMHDMQASQFLPSMLITSYSSFSKARLRAGSYYVESLNNTQQQASAGGTHSIQKSILITFMEKLATDRGATVILAIWNILPLLQGSAVFSMPYSVAVGGYSILVAIALMSLMADVTGLILTDCLYDISPRSQTRKRVHMDYVDIARTVWGEHGARLMNVILVFYLFTGDVVNVLLIGKSVHDVLKPYTSLSFAVLTSIFSIACYPTLFITRLTILAYLSMLSVFSIIVGIIAVVCVFVQEHDVWSSNMAKIPFFDTDGFPLAVSIVMFSCLSHSVLPQIEGNMAEPKKSSRAIHISYLSSGLLKVIVSAMGALTYGALTQSIVTLNAGEHNFPARIVCAIALTGFGIFNYPLNMFVVCETCDALVENTRFGKQGKLYYFWMAVSRFALTALSVILALVVPYFGILLAIRGSLIGTCLIFVFPCYFHLRLKWKKLTRFQVFVDILLIVIGLALGTVGLYSSCANLVKAIRTDMG